MIPENPQVFVDYISFRFYMKYIWKKYYKNFFGRPYRSNGTKIHMDAALSTVSINFLIQKKKNRNS